MMDAAFFKSLGVRDLANGATRDEIYAALKERDALRAKVEELEHRCNQCDCDNQQAIAEQERILRIKAEARVAELEQALVDIRDSTYRSAVTLRGLADERLATFGHVSRVQSDEVTYGLALPNEIDAAIDAAMEGDAEPTEPLDHCGACGQWLGGPVSCCYKSHDFPPVTKTQGAKIREGKE